jgi:hypothetical protein
MRIPVVALLTFLVLTACGSASPQPRTAPRDSAERMRAEERSYLRFRREERSCGALSSAAELAFGQESHLGVLDPAELLIAFCPEHKLRAVEKTIVLLAADSAKAPTRRDRSVSLRLDISGLRPEYHLFWLAAYADGKLGLNDLVPGGHRIDVELHLWQAGPRGHEQLLRLQKSIEVTVDEREPVVLNLVLQPQSSSLVPYTMELAPAPEKTDSAARPVSAGYHRLEMASGDEMPFPRPPQPLTQAGFSASIDLEICMNGEGRITRITPLSWPHPRFLGAYVEGLRAWRLQPYLVNGKPETFCTGWKQTLDTSPGHAVD